MYLEIHILLPTSHTLLHCNNKLHEAEDNNNYKSISKRQTGTNNTCHRMTKETFDSMCIKNSIKIFYNKNIFI